MLVSRLRWLAIAIFVAGVFSFVVLTTTVKAAATSDRGVMTKICTETDRGNNKMTKGVNTISYEDGTVYTTGSDYCYDKNTVAEFTCGGGQWSITYESCGDGYACDLGACLAVAPAAVIAKPTCRDTDGGDEIFTKGTLSVYTPSYGNQTVVEACADDKTMDELICLTGDPTYAYTHKKTACPYGCKDGACIATAPVVNTKADIGLYGFLKIGQNKTEVRWNETITLTREDAFLVSGSQAAFNLYYTDKNYGDARSGLYRNAITFDGKLVSQQTNRQLDAGVKEDIWTQAYFPIGNGAYALKFSIDADGQVVESSETNNNFTVYVKLSGFEERAAETTTETTTETVDQCNVSCQNRYNVRGSCGSNLSNTTIESDYCSRDSKCYCMVVAVRYDASAKSTIIAPSDGATLINYPRQAEIQWTPITSISKYELEVACDYCGSTRWGSVNTWTSAAVYMITPALAGDNQFRARVRGMYPDNTYSQWSDYVYFNYKTIAQPTTQPATQPTVEPTIQPTAEPATEPLPTQPVIEKKPVVVVPKVTKKPVGRMLCGNSSGGDGIYTACKNNTIKHDSGITVKVRTYDNRNVWLTIGKATTKYIRVPFKKGIEVKRTDGEIILKISYIKKSPKYGVYLQVETTFDANAVEEEEDVIESDETSSGGGGSLLPAYDETKPSVTFGVGVNDYPSHEDSAKSKNIANAFVNMHTVSLADNGTFKVLSYITENTGAAGAANLTVKSGQMVYFEGYRTEAAAKAGAVKMASQTWTTPPYKNFSSVKNMLCQTNYSKTDEFLGGTQDYACASSLSTPYQD